MKEHPILFSAPMVRAILSGQKTQTRRIIPDQNCLSKCRFGKVGDRLWVRETFTKDNDIGLCYKADFAEDGNAAMIWKPSIFMPRIYSRITLEIIGIHSSQLRALTEDDAKREGLNTASEFKELWDKLNAKRGYGWDVNPWVWVVSFKVISENADKQ